MKKSIALLFASLVLFSCQSVPDTGKKTDEANLAAGGRPEPTQEDKENARIEESFLKAKIVMTFDDIPYSYWNQTTENQCMFFKVYLIDYNGVLGRNAISKMRVYDNFGSVWSQALTVSGLMVSCSQNNYTTSYSFNGSLLSVEKYRIEIETKNGKTLSRDYFPKQHMKSNEEKMLYIFSNEYAGKVLASYKKALARPIITSAYFDDGYLNVEFSVNDPRVRNVSIELYTQAKVYAGWTKYLYNAFSDETSPSLNGGEKLRVDGSPNAVKFPANDLLFMQGKGIADTARIIITAYDNEFPDFLSNTEDMTLLLTQSEMTDLGSEDKKVE